jgi:hypothetical protein
MLVVRKRTMGKLDGDYPGTVGELEGQDLEIENCAGKEEEEEEEDEAHEWTAAEDAGEDAAVA